MATRFYFPATGYVFPPNVDRNTSPAYSGGWSAFPAPAPGRSPSSFFKPAGVSGSYLQFRSVLTNPEYEMLQQYISEPIPAFSFTGAHTWSGQFICSHETVTVPNVMGGACAIRLVSNNGITERGSLLNWFPVTLGAPPGATQSAIWATLPTNRQLPANGLVSSAVTSINGDRLVFEIGFTMIDANPGQRGQVFFNAAGTTDLNLGDQAQTDQALNGFIETSADIFGGVGRTCRTRATT